MIQMCYENRNQAMMVKIHPVTPIVEMLKENDYIESDFDAEPLFDTDTDDQTYWENVGIIADGVIDWLNDEIEAKEERIVEAIENGNPYDDEYWEESSTMSEMDKWEWIIDEMGKWADFVTIRDVTGSENPYRYQIGMPKSHIIWAFWLKFPF